MSVLSDPLADMLTRVRNSLKAGHLRVDMPSSKLKISVARIFKNEGFIKNYKILDDKRQKVLRIYLKYGNERQPAIYDLERISRPGRRVYKKAEELKPIMNNVGIWILSTSKGVITNKAAKKLNVGGEILCKIS